MKVKISLFKSLFWSGFIIISMVCTNCKEKNEIYEPTYSVDTAQKEILLLGVPTQAHYETYSAFVKYLNDHLSDIQIQTVATSNFPAYVNKIDSGLFDLALANAVLALDSSRLGYGILGISVEKTANAGVIVVHKDSSVNDITDLKGRTIASTGSPALAGHMLPMMYLLKQGLNVNREIKLKYFESFESLLINMYLGEYSVGFASINGWQNIIQKKPEIASKLAVKWVTPAVVGNPLLIRNTVSAKTVNKLRELLLTMHLNEQGKKALADIGYVKFLQPEKNSYEPFKIFLKEYKASIIDPKR